MNKLVDNLNLYTAVGKTFSNMMQSLESIKQKINKPNHIKIKTFCKEVFKIKTQIINWEISAINSLEKKSSIHEKLL